MSDHERGAAGRHDAAPLPLWLRMAPIAFLLFWSGGYTGVRIGMADIEPIFFLAVRYMGVLAVLVPVFLVLRPPLPKAGRDWAHLVVVGILVQGLYFGGTNVAVKLGITAVGMAIILALQPILVALIVPWLARERVGVRAWLGLLLGLAGTLVTVLAKGGTAAGTVAGIIATVFALIFITAGTLWEKRFGRQHHIVTANLIQCSAALAVSLPAALLLEECTINWTPTFAAALSYLVVFNSIIAMTLLFAMIRRGAASRVTALFFLVPPTSSVIAWALLGEELPALTFVGMALAAAGLLLVGRPMSR